MIAIVLSADERGSPDVPLAEQERFAEHVALMTASLDGGVAVEAGPFALEAS